MVQDFDCKIRILPDAYVVCAALLLLIPLPWAFSWMIAAVWHELFHCFALMLCRKHIQKVVIGVSGSEIKTSVLSDMETLICTLAGPIGGLSLLLVSGIFPRLAICGFLQSVYNILPIYPLDGGRAIRGLAGLILSERAAKILCNSLENLLIILIVLFGFFLTAFLKLGLFPALMAVFFVAHIKKIKIPCK